MLLAINAAKNTDFSQQATGNRQQATGNRQQATGNRQQNYAAVFHFVKYLIAYYSLFYQNSVKLLDNKSKSMVNRSKILENSPYSGRRHKKNYTI
jgi:hypothetical protein